MNMVAEPSVDAPTDLSPEINEIIEISLKEELTALERCQYLKMWQELHIKEHPGRTHGVNFRVSTAKILQVGTSVIGKQIHIATHLSECVQRALKGTPIENNQAALSRLARLPATEQEEFVAQLKDDTLRTVPMSKSPKPESPEPEPDAFAEVQKSAKHVDRLVREELQSLQQRIGGQFRPATKDTLVRTLISFTNTLLNSQPRRLSDV